MKHSHRARLWTLRLIIIALGIVVVLDLRTAATQHAHYQDELRRSDSRVIAQALQSLFRDSAAITASWSEAFILGSGTGSLFCPATGSSLPIKNVSGVLAPYLRILPQDPDNNLTSASLYYISHHDNRWFVGNCALTQRDEVMVL
jgi:hypothetical protein